jgi:hypothetical protein
MRRRPIFIGMGCLLLAFAIWFGQFESSEICTTCGQMQDVTEFQLPFTSFTYFTTRRQTATPFSIAMNRAGLVPSNHKHQWLYATGGGNGVKCAIGEGRHLLTAVTSPEVATFLQATATYQGRAATRTWTTALLDPTKSDNAATAIRCAHVPPAGFATKAAYDSWLQSQLLPLKSALDSVP